MKSKAVYWEAASLGIYIAVSIALGVLVGRWADGKLQTDPWLTVAGLTAGVVAAGREVWRVVKRLSAKRDGG